MTPGKEIIKKLDSDPQFICGRCQSFLFKFPDIIEHQPLIQNLQTSFVGFQLPQLGQSQTNKMISKKSYNGMVMNNVQCSEYFIQKKDWINISEGHFGSICCPKKACRQKIGVYSTLGLKCTCGKQINPGYLIYRNKVNKHS